MFKFEGFFFNKFNTNTLLKVNCIFNGTKIEIFRQKQ